MKVTCQQCGADNQLGTIFCRSCGIKLDINAMAPGRGTPKKTVQPGKLLGRLIRLTLLLALLVVLGMLCWGTEAPGDAPAPDGVDAVVSKMTALRGAVIGSRDLVQTMTEAEVNAYINERITRAASSGGAMKMTLQKVSLDIQDDKIIAWMNTKLGPVPLTYTAETTVSRGSTGRLDFDTGAVYIGRLGMPGPLRNRVINQFLAVFTAFRDENVLLSRLAHVRLMDGAIEFGTVAQQ